VPIAMAYIYASRRIMLSVRLAGNFSPAISHERIGALSSAIRSQSTVTASTSAASNVVKESSQRLSQGAQAIVSRLTPFLAGIGRATSGLVERYPTYTKPILYWTRVTGEISKEVWYKEKLAPPSIEQFQRVYSDLLKSVYAFNTQTLLNIVNNIDSKSTSSFLLIALQVIAFFTVGEIIGRRHLIGYKVAEPKKTEH